MSYELYRTIHFIGLILLFTGLGSRLALFAMQKNQKTPIKSISGIFHGVGLILIALGGFGMLARLKLGFEGWLYGKIIIWLVLGFITLIPKKNYKSAPMTLVLSVILGAIAVYFVVAKPM